MFIDCAAKQNCINPASYGAICVGCNACGRIDESTQKQSELKLYKELLQDEYDFNNWIEGYEERQRINIAANIEYFNKKIAELENKLK